MRGRAWSLGTWLLAGQAHHTTASAPGRTWAMMLGGRMERSRVVLREASVATRKLRRSATWVEMRALSSGKRQGLVM